MSLRIDILQKASYLTEVMMQNEVTVEQFEAIRQAGRRMFRIYGIPQQDLSLTEFFTSHEKDIIFDCQSFQGITITTRHIQWVTTAIENIVSLNNFPREIESLVERAVLNTKLIKDKESVNMESILSRAKQYVRGLGILKNLTRPNNRRSQLIPDDRRAELSRAEEGYVLAEEADNTNEGVAVIINAINKLPLDMRKVLYGLIQGQTENYSPEDIQAARQALQKVLYGDKESNNSQSLTVERNRPVSITESHQKLGDIAKDMGLENFFNLIQRVQLPYDEIIWILYYFGYFHSNETEPIFAGNERGIHISSALNALSRASSVLSNITTFPSQTPTVSLAEYINTIEQESFERRKGKERYPSPTTNGKMITDIVAILKAHPDRIVRIVNGNHRKIIDTILQGGEQEPAISMEHLYNLLKGSSYKSYNVLHIDVQRILGRLISEEFPMGIRAILRDSGVREIIQANPSAEVAAVIASEPLLKEVYDFLHNPKLDGSYRYFHDMQNEIHIHRRWGYFLLGVLKQDVGYLLRINKKRPHNELAIKTLALQLGATADLFVPEDNLSDAELQEAYGRLTKFTVQKLHQLNVQGLLVLAEQVNCPVEWLSKIRDQEPEKLTEMILRYKKMSILMSNTRRRV